MSGVQTQSVSYMPANSFRVLVDGLGDAGDFMKAGPLFKAKVDEITIRSGTSLVPEAVEPGNVTPEPLTLEQGVTKNQVLYNMFLEVVNAGGDTGNNGPTFKHTIRVEQLDRDKTTVLVSYTFKNAWVSEYEEGSFDASSSEFRIRVCRISYQGMPIKTLGA